LCTKSAKLKNTIWLYNTGYTNRSKNSSINKWAFADAAEHGDLKILNWLLSHNFKSNTRTFAAAAKNGNLENMK
jgi:hypothetical protein